MAAPTIAQHKSNFGTSVTSVTVTLGSNVTAGNMLVIFVGTIRASVDTINTPTMTGETFTKITNASNAGSGSFGQVALYLTNTNAGNTAAGGHSALTVTISSTADDLHVHVIEVSGQSGSPQDATGNTESTTLSVSTSTSTSTANDLILAFFYDNVNNQTLSAGSGYAIVEQSNNTTGGDVGLSISKTVSSTGTQTATASGNAGNTCEQSIIAIAGTASGGPTVDQLSPSWYQDMADSALQMVGLQAYDQDQDYANAIRGGLIVVPLFENDSFSDKIYLSVSIPEFASNEDESWPRVIILPAIVVEDFTFYAGDDHSD